MAAASSPGESTAFDRSSDHCRKWIQSGCGTPRASPITVIGSGNDRSPMMSSRPSPRARASSSKLPAISSMRGRRAATRRGVKALLMIDRSLAWSGGSMAPSQRWKMAVTGAKAGGTALCIPTVSGLLAKVAVSMRTAEFSA